MSTTARLQWDRFWYPRGIGCDLNDGGYLLDPSEGAKFFFKSSVVTYQSMAPTQCLILLGEPGTGKSDVMLQLRDHPRILGESEGERLWIDLKEMGDARSALEAIQESHVFQSWSSGKSGLTLCLDSLDECMLHAPVVARQVVRELSKHRAACEQLKLRVACRTADWPTEIESDLSALWSSKSAVEAFELAPLKRSDVIAAALDYAVDADGFQQELARVNCVPFAIKPITLHLLLRIFRQDGKLPNTQAEIYRRGCQQLCEEQTRHRRERVDRTSARQRLLIGGRIAAITTFCNRSTVYRGAEHPASPSSVAALGDLAGGQEGSTTDIFSVDEGAILETLNTGLFSSRGPDRFGWAHQTYSEFLAAEYLRLRGMPTVQILSLIGQTIDNAWRVVPQLQEVAGWLSNEMPEIREQLMRHDPTVLLRSDVAGTDDVTRANLTASLLACLDRGEVFDWKLMFGGNYRKLLHPGLSEQLRPYLIDRTKPWDVRRFAIDVIRQTELKGLVPDLVVIALDSTEDTLTRNDAAYTITEIGDADAKAALLPLARGQAGDDPQDQLKGSGLTAIWPEHISAAEVFSLVTFPKKLNFFGQYKNFLSRELVEQLPPDDLPVGLRWAASIEYHQTAIDPVSEVADRLITKAWDSTAINAPFVDGFAETIMSRLRQHAAVVRIGDSSSSTPLWEIDDPRRRRLLLEIVRRGSEPTFPLSNLYFSKPRLLVPSDIPWMIGLARASSADETSIWVDLISRGFFYDLSHADDIFDALDIPGMEASVGIFFEPMELEAPESLEWREKWKEQAALFAQNEPPLLDPTPAARLESALQNCEQGNSNAWLDVIISLALRPRQWDTVHDGWDKDIRTLPGWAEATAEARTRAVTAAKRHLDQVEPEPSQIIQDGRFTYAVHATYRAAILIAYEDRTWLESSSKEKWVRWSPYIVGFGTMASSNGEDAGVYLFGAAYRANPDLIISLTLDLAGGEEGTHGYHLYPLKRVWDERIAAALFAKATDPLTPIALAMDLVERLMEHRDANAIAFAVREVSQPLPQVGPSRDRFAAFASLLIQYAPAAGWVQLWAAMASDDDWARAFMCNTASRLDRHASHVKIELSEPHLATLYAWLFERYPPAEDPDNGPGMTRVSDRDSIAGYRDSILGHLQSRGTPAAVEALAAIAARWPTMRHLRWAHQVGRDELLKKNWEPASPVELMTLVQNATSRIVQDGSQLMDLLIESLNRWEAKLQGTPPAAFHLWDGTRPKKEDELSDDIVLHLRDDLCQYGLVVNREVVIRKGEKPGGIGERTDILVQATRKMAPEGKADVITVIIECKGSWNSGLMNDIKDQLRDRYLVDNECRHGLYFVGWYACPQWDPTDWRHAATARLDRERVARDLNESAKSLSTNGVQLRAAVLRTGLR